MLQAKLVPILRFYVVVVMGCITGVSSCLSARLSVGYVCRLSNLVYGLNSTMC